MEWRFNSTCDHPESVDNSRDLTRRTEGRTSVVREVRTFLIHWYRFLFEAGQYVYTDWIKVRIFSKTSRYLVLKVLKVLQNSQGSRIFKVRIFLTGGDKYFTESCLPNCCGWLISELIRTELLLTGSIFYNCLLYFKNTPMHLFTTKIDIIIT